MSQNALVVDDPYELLRQIHMDKEAKIVRNEQTPGAILYDVECVDETTSNEFLKQNLRLGNSFIQVLRDEQVYSTSIARRGLRHPYLIQRTEGKILNISSDIEKAFRENRKIKVYSTLKVDGENAQVSYHNHLKCWLVASKNVSLLAQDITELQKYTHIRYRKAKLIASAWFQILKKVKDEQGPDAIIQLQRILTDRTMIGEYCGDQTCQHIVKYEKVQLVWFALVEHTSKEDCLDIATSMAFFKHHKLDVVQFKDEGKFSELKQLNEFLVKHHDFILGSSCEDEHEGSVLYFQLLPLRKEEPTVLSVGQVRTLEYGIFKNLREKLRRYVDEKDSKCSQLINAFEDELVQSTQSVKPPKSISYYIEIAESAFDFAYYFPDYNYLIHDEYVTFLSIVISCVNNKIKFGPKLQKDFIDQLLSTPLSFSSPAKKKKCIIPVFPIGIPGMGKSTLFHAIQNQIMESYGDVNVTIISNDKLRAYLVNAEQDQQKYKLTQDEVFKRTSVELKIRYWKEIDNQIKSFHTDNKFSTFIVLLDKNHIPKDLGKAVSEFKKYQTDDMQVLTVGLIPDCAQPFEKDGIKLPFSLNFLMTCIERVQSRTQHETLPGRGAQSLGVMSLFIKLFEGQDLNTKCLDHRIAYQYVKENQGNIFGSVCESDLVEILKKTPLGSKCPDEQILADFLDSLTYNKPKDCPLDVEAIAQRSAELVKDILDKFEIKPTPKLKRRKSEISKNFHVQFTLEQPLPLEQPRPLYLAIFIDPKDNDKIKQWVTQGLKEAYSQLPQSASAVLKDVEREFLARHFKQFHITTLFIGKNFEKMQTHPAYLKFKPNEHYTIELDYFIAIQDNILAIVVKRKDLPPIANKIPHFTAYINQLSPKDSNEVVQRVPSPTNKEPYIFSTVEVKDKKLKALTIWPKQTLTIRGMTKEHYETKKFAQDD